MANTLIFRSLPANETGITLTTPAVAWGYSPWKVIAKKIPRDIYITGITFEANFVLAADDTTNEQIFEIGLGNVSDPTVKLQVPHSWRADTRVGFYPTAPLKHFFPEPFQVVQGSTICVRVARSIATAVSYKHIKILYQSDVEINNANANKVSFNNYLFFHGLGSGGEVIR